MTQEFAAITLPQIAKLPRPGTAGPAGFRFTPDGAGILYLQSDDGSLTRSLWLYDIASGQRTVLAGPAGAALSREEELRRERERILAHGVTSYEVAPTADGLTILVPGGERLRVYRRGELAELPGSERVQSPRISRDGSTIAFVKDGEVFALPVDGGTPRQLTEGAGDGVTNGLADFVAHEEFGRGDGFWWSPDGARIAFIQVDSIAIPVFSIVHQGRDEYEVETHRYPFAGEANATLRLGIIEVGGGECRWLDVLSADDEYIIDVAWRPDGALALQTLSRDQRRLRLRPIDASTGDVLALHEETGDPWVNTGHDHRFLDDCRLVWASERSGYRHLYVYDQDLRCVRQLTYGNWMVTRLVAVDEAGGVAYFTGTRSSVRERHLYAVPLDGGDVRQVTSGAGWHDAVVSRDGGQFVDVLSSLAEGPSVSLRPTSGGEPVTFYRDESATAEALGLAVPELISVPGADGTMLDAAFYRPPGDPPFPLVVSVYGGPHAQRVMDEWSLTVDLRAQYLAQHGFAVLRVDNRGSANRGMAFEATLAGRMGTVEVDDQAAAVQHLAGQGLIDPGRVGIYGWSYGGYMAALCLMKRPDVFRVAVAGAPVVDWDGYDTGYTERYMGTPAENPGGYREAAVTTHVAGLEGRLLLVHGMVDENVHFRHTARLITALTAAQKAYDLLIFPEERHVPRDAAGLEYMERRLTEYFFEHL